jgi:hypothetical protein
MTRSLSLAVGIAACAAACSSTPQPVFKKFAFPGNAYTGDIQRPYDVLGPVRSRVDFPSLDVAHDEKELCRNYFNKAARDLVKYAKRQGADAVIDVKSVVFLVDGRTETHLTPECSDDGAMGQVLAQGVAVKWKGPGVEAGTWVSPLAKQKEAEAAAAKAELDAKAEKTAKETKSAVAWPTAARSGMPMMPEGGTLVPDADEDEMMASTPREKPEPAQTATTVTAPLTVPLTSPPATAPAIAPAAPAFVPAAPVAEAPAAEGPATVQMVPTTSAAPVRRPAAHRSEPRKTDARKSEGEEARAANAPRLPFADPRAIPGSFRRALP